MGRRRISVGTAVMVGLLALSGCADPADDEATDPTGATLPEGVSEVDPVDLIGNWTIAGTGAESDQVLRLAFGQLRVWRECGSVTGVWSAARSGLFVAHPTGGSAGCGSADQLEVDWLQRSSLVQPDGDGLVLLDEAGDPTARLLPGGEPPPSEDLADSELAPPEVTEQVRQALRPADPLPAELTPAGPGELTGRWTPVSGTEPAFVELSAGGEWHGSDGCNELAGRWAADSTDGTLVAVTGPSTQIWCDNASVGEWLESAARAGLTGDELVLVDRHGAELGRLRPE